MAYASLKECVDDLTTAGKLRVVDAALDCDLEVAAVHRRVFAAGGPALLFRNARGSKFPLVSNLFGTKDRAYYILRHGLESARTLLAARLSPADMARHPLRAATLPAALAHALPRFVKTGPALDVSGRVADLPSVRAWPRDGGPFITLPQVYTEHPDVPGVMKSNLGMYRVQLSGNDYEEDEVGLHYQIHRGIGVHHAAALAKNGAKGEALRVNIFVGGPPAMTLAAVLPLPEGVPEVAFAGVLGGRAARFVRGTPCVHADADFVIRGVVQTRLKREGPFGDHLGYYSEAHDFPVMHVESVTHRKDAIWPFTVVGRPPQEDSIFGEIIHELFGATVSSVVPGVRDVHAVDESGVHPLLLAVGSERYVPYAKTTRPMELLTQANAILGQGQMSLAKYLFIIDGDVRANDVPAFFRHMLERVDPTRDLHFQTHTTIDTLDYSGTALNEGSKLVIAACGDKKRELATASSFGRVAMPGVLVVSSRAEAERAESGFPLVVIADDAEFTARTLANFLWVTFTRSDPARHVDGVGAFMKDKAWGCTGAIIIDARIKPGQAPVLEEDPDVTKRIEALAVRGGPLAGLF